MLEVLAVLLFISWSAAAQAQVAPENANPALPPPLKGQPGYGTLSPGQVGGPVLSHPELATPEHRRQEAEEAKEYCRTHECRSIVGAKRLPGWREAMGRTMRAWGATLPVRPSAGGIMCEADPAHPTGPAICHRVGPATGGNN